MQYGQQQPDNVTNIFVRQDRQGVDPFHGPCWPGDSVWIDFLNENAANFWSDLFSFERFKGSDWMISAWNDMNEPAVFSNIKTVPATAVHVKADGTKVNHRDFHNAYGALHQKASFNGLLKRDENGDGRRPFVLTRSFFIGSQKYGTYWTGDNRAIFSELEGSLAMILQLGNAGIPFGGADVPGFFGDPTEDLWILFYQLGMYYPFFRAHSHIDYQTREPWAQTERV